MANLKDKLAQKVEIINSSTIPDDVPEDSGTSDFISEQGSNVIMLKNTGNSSISSIVPNFAISLNEAKNRLLMLQNYIKEVMIPGIDYGLIPKCEKPTLFKSGAEKLTDIFGFSKQFEVINRIEDWEKPLFHYEIKAVLTNKKTGLIEAEGLGCCNNRERKFKNQDGYSIINTILKMAKKRALIDAVLSATRSSGIFTQDIEDNEEINNASFNNSNASNHNIPVSSQHSKINPSTITREQQSQIFVAASKNNVPLDYIKELMIEKYKVAESKLLTSEQADELIAYLKSYSII